MREALLPAIAASRDMHCVGAADSPMDVLDAAHTGHADVVVVPAPGDELPGVASHLFAEFPGIAVLAIGTTQAAMYRLEVQRRPIRDTSVRGVLAAIRSAMRSGEPDDPAP
jgi:hypothetical protein